jgi:hypothetical protein
MERLLLHLLLLTLAAGATQRSAEFLKAIELHRNWLSKEMLRSFLLLLAAIACHAAIPHSTSLFHPNSASMNAPCPHTYTVLFHTTKGNFEVQVEQAWAPIGAQRFYNLVKNGERRVKQQALRALTPHALFRFLQRRCLLSHGPQLHGPVWHPWKS